MLRSITCSVDRIEEGTAALVPYEDKQESFTLPACFLPDDVKAGDSVLIFLSKDEDETERQRGRVGELIGELTDEDRI
jgi:hypothetical protein